MSTRGRLTAAPRSIQSTTTTIAPKQPPLPLSKRLLLPFLSASSPLPPLLASEVPPEFTADLYTFIALGLRSFVNPWWSKITRYDKEFLPEINRVLSAVLRALELRLVNTDLAPLVFHDLPILVTQHYRDIRSASAKLSTSYASGGSASLPQLFHQLQPHMALSSAGDAVDEMYIRQIAEHILKSCLPEEDYAPEAERFIVREVLVKVLTDVMQKVVEPWFLYKLVTDLLPVEEEPPPPLAASTPERTHFSFHTLLVIFLSAIQSISGTCLALIHAYKQIVGTIKTVNHAPPPSQRFPQLKPTSPYTSSSPASSTSSLSSPISPLASTPQAHERPNAEAEVDDYAHASLMMISEIFTMGDRFASGALMNSIYAISALFTTFFDCLLPHLLYTHVLCASYILHIIRLSTATLFPNGYLAPSPVLPTEAEQLEIRATLLRRLGGIASGSSVHLSTSAGGIPDNSWNPRALLFRVLLGSTAEARTGVLEGVLDGIADKRCNMHLLVFILDALVLRVFPEMGSSVVGVGDHGGERAGGLGELSRSVSAATTHTNVTPPGSVHI